MSVLDTLITDRTQTDVNEIIALRNKIVANGWDNLSNQEKSAFMLNHRGTYNSSDMNRVGNAVSYVATEMGGQETLIRAYCNSVGVGYTSEFAVPY